MEHYLGYGEPINVDEQLFIEKYNILERRKSELGELGMIGDASMFKNPYEPQDRIPKMIGALVTPYTEHRTLPHMMDMTPGLGALLGALTTPYTEHRSLPHLIDMTPGLGGAEGKNPYEPQDTIPRMIGAIGAEQHPYVPVARATRLGKNVIVLAWVDATPNKKVSYVIGSPDNPQKAFAQVRADIKRLGFTRGIHPLEYPKISKLSNIKNPVYYGYIDGDPIVGTTPGLW